MTQNVEVKAGFILEEDAKHIYTPKFYRQQ